MKVLIIGGTGFIGKHITEYFIKANCEVTLFNRGIRGKDLFKKNVLFIEGDRKNGFHEITNDDYDLVIDTYGYFPSNVRALCEKTNNIKTHFIFISSVSIYDNGSIDTDFITEDSKAIETVYDVEPTAITEGNYGALKYQCEQVVSEYFPNRHTIIRPGYVVGPFDHTNRFAYWIDRIAKSCEILVPGSMDAPIQFIDVRDLSKFIFSLGINKTPGVFNAAGPEESLTFSNFLNVSRYILKSECEFFSCEEEVYNKLVKETNKQIPFWTPRSNWKSMKVKCDTSVKHGLEFRSYKSTIEDVYSYIMDNSTNSLPEGIMDLTTEARLINAFTDPNNKLAYYQ